MKYVVDTTALFNARDLPPDFEIIVPQGVLDELVSWGLSDRVQMLLGTKIHLHAPSDASREKIRSASHETGDIDRLSQTDTDVLALALELDAIIISDDYSIQNVSELLGIHCIPMEESGIKRLYFWKYRCMGCGKEFERRLRECDVCGQVLKPFRHRSEDISPGDQRR